MKYAVATSIEEAREAVSSGFGFDSFTAADDALSNFRWRYKNNSCQVFLVSMTALERCQHEQDEIQRRPDVASGKAPAWLVTLGMEDWEFERQFHLED